MATFSRAESQRLYSWWWDSHISPKNSKWLKENLTDMDAKVKLMIKLIEEDADSFAKRAEMYYKKRPELMKLVEEFYRAYRALAERYDHATGALCQAHKTMEEAQIPFVPADNSPTGSSSTEYEPHTPEMPHPSPASCQPNELHKDALDLSPSLLYAIKRPVTYSSERDSISKKGLKQLNDLFVSGAYHVKFAEARVTKGLNFDGEEKQGSNQTLKAQITSKSEQTHKVQSEVQTLKEALAKLEAEKEADLLQYQQTLARLSNLETEVSHAHDDARGVNERATKADAEVQILNQALAELRAEKEDSLKQYQQCLDRISCLETKLSSGPEDAGGPGERPSKAESEVQNLKQAYARLEAVKKASLLQHKHLSETISSLETKLAHAEEDARSLNERAIRAETEVKFLKESIAKLEEDKEAAALQYQRSLERISYLEGEVSQAQEEATRLSHLIVMGVAKLSSTEEQYLILERETQYLQSEVNDLVEKMAFQEQELVEKNEELRRLQFCTQQEFMLSMEAEATLDRYQEEQQTLELELENGVQRMKEMELRYQLLEEEIQQIKEENKTLKEQKLSSAFSMKEVDDETTSLTEMDERNALQQEIHHLKEQLNGLNKVYLGLIEQVKLVGLEPDHFGSSVKDLQVENSRLKEIAEKESHEKVALFEKVENMENLSGKNALLENSLSDLTVRLEALREKSKALEETCQLLQREKSILVDDKDTLLAQLETATENAGLLSKKDALLESSLSDANAELEGLRSNLKSLEEFCKSLENEKSGLVTEREIMFAQLNTIQERLEGVEMRYTALEERYLGLVKENESRVHQLKKLQTALDLEKQEHASFAQSSKSLVAYLRGDVEILRDKGDKTKEEFEEEQDRSIRAQLEIIILHSCLQDMVGKNRSLLIECQKHFEASMSLEKLLTELRKENIEEQVKVKSLLNQIGRMRSGIRRMFAIKSASDYDRQDKFEDDEILLDLVLSKMRDLENHLMETHDEKQQLLFEKSVLLTLLGQMRFDTVNLVSERNILDKDLKCMTEELHMQQTAKQVILETNEQLRLELTSKNQQQMELKAEMENQSMELSTLQEVYPLLQNENSKLLEENKSLVKEVADAQKENCRLEEENSDLIEEVMNLSNLCIVFSKFGAEKVAELKELTEDVNHLNGVNDGLEKKVRKMAEMLTMVGAESLLHKESVEKLENEVSVLKSESAHLNHHVDTGKSLLNQKEVELSETKHRLEATESENLELLGKLEDLTRDCKEARATKEVLEKQILELHEEIKNQRVKEDDFSYDLLQQRNETKLWEEEASTLYGDCQATDFYADILKEKVSELVEACKILEDGITSKTRDREQMKERLDVLESESEGMKSQLAACLPLIESLRDSILSLEDHILPLTKTHVADKSETEVCLADIRLHENSCKELNGNQSPMLRDGVSSLLELQTMVKAIQNSVVEKTRLVAQESSDTNTKLEAAMKEIEELRSQRYSARVEDVKAGGSTGTEQEKLGEEHCNPESSGSEILMKDIPLDQASHSSSYDRGSGLHALSGIVETDDEMLESFLPAEQDCNLSLAYKTPEVTNNFLQIEVVEQHKSEHPSPDLQTEKELLVDKLIISKRHSGLHGEGNERKILKGIASDVQKLRNLQIAVQDLKKKVEQFEKSKKAKKIDKGKDMEYAIVKVELKEVEEAVMQLLDVNRELTKSITQLPFMPDEKGVLKLEEKGRVLRRSGFSEQAEQGSEKIGRLQLEVQRIQFVLLRLEDGHKTKGTKVSDRRVQLRDYLYGPGRSYSNSRKRKAPLFACVKPPMESD